MSGIPLLLIPLAIYNVLAFVLPGLNWTLPLSQLALPSGIALTLTLGDAFICSALGLLFVEIVKAAGASKRNLVDHLLSSGLFIAAMLEFLLIPLAATPTFLMLLVILLVDMIGGWAVSLKSVSRDVSVHHQAI